MQLFLDTGLVKAAWALVLVCDGSRWTLLLTVRADHCGLLRTRHTQSCHLPGGHGWELTLSHKLEAGTARFSAHWCPAALVAGRGPSWVPTILGRGEGHGPCPGKDKAETLQVNQPPAGFMKHKNLRLPLDATHPGQDQGNEMEMVTYAIVPCSDMGSDLRHQDLRQNQSFGEILLLLAMGVCRKTKCG